MPHSPLPHHAGRGVTVGVDMDEGQGTVSGGAGPEDGVGDQVVTTQAHGHTPSREDGPDMNTQVGWDRVDTILLVLLCNAVTCCLHVIETRSNIPDVSNLIFKHAHFSLTEQWPSSIEIVNAYYLNPLKWIFSCRIAPRPDHH